MRLGIKDYAFYALGFGKKIHSVEPDFFIKESVPVKMEFSSGKLGGLAHHECAFLCALAASMKCQNFFEIGTCGGLTAYNIAQNIPGTIYTLDLPAGESQTVLSHERAEKTFMGTPDSARFWVGKPEEKKIISLRGDSARFDFKPYEKKMDLVFVDGSHAYDYVASDSKNALSLIRPGGVIVWHDYAPCWPGSVKALNELSERIPLHHLKRTSLILHLSK